MSHDAILTVQVARIDQETPVVKRFALVPAGAIGCRRFRQAPTLPRSLSSTAVF